MLEINSGANEPTMNPRRSGNPLSTDIHLVADRNDNPTFIPLDHPASMVSAANVPHRFSSLLADGVILPAGQLLLYFPATEGRNLMPR